MRSHRTAALVRLFALSTLGVSCWLSCEQLPSGPAQVAPGGIRGMTLAAWNRDLYATPLTELAIDRLAGLGVTHLMLLTTAYQSDRHSNDPSTDPMLTPSLESLAHAAATARAKGLQVAIKPHVDVRDGTWRGLIEPTDAGAWFEAYRAFVLPLASLADSVGAVQFIVGTELGSTLTSDDEWRRTITEVRERFRGDLTYAASWDEAALVPFWGELDQVGIDAYFPILERSDAGRLEILAGWQIWLERLEQLHRKASKPVVITEIGYRSVDGAGMAPFDYRRQGQADPGEQADLYWGALEALSGADWVRGVYWWAVSPDGPTAGIDLGYTPLGKPAEAEIKMSWSGK